jgi:hypothetical protein
LPVGKAPVFLTCGLWHTRYNGTADYVIGHVHRGIRHVVTSQTSATALKHLSVEFPLVVSLEDDGANSVVTIFNILTQDSKTTRLPFLALYAMAGQKDVLLVTSSELFSVSVDGSSAPRNLVLSSPLIEGLAEPQRHGKWLLLMVRHALAPRGKNFTETFGRWLEMEIDIFWVQGRVMTSFKREFQLFNIETRSLVLQESARNKQPFLKFKFNGNSLVAFTADSVYIWNDLEGDSGTQIDA